MYQPGNIKDKPHSVPDYVIKAVVIIENYARSATNRDDWVIGGVACRQGTERLLKQYNCLLRKYNKIKDIINENPSHTRHTSKSRRS